MGVQPTEYSSTALVGVVSGNRAWCYWYSISGTKQIPSYGVAPCLVMGGDEKKSQKKKKKKKKNADLLTTLYPSSEAPQPPGVGDEKHKHPKERKEHIGDSGKKRRKLNEHLRHKA